MTTTRSAEIREEATTPLTDVVSADKRRLLQSVKLGGIHFG